MTLKDQILEKLAALGQKELAAGLDGLSPSQQESFFTQLKKYDIHLLKRQREALFRPLSSPPSFEPLTQFEVSGSQMNRERGRRILSEGKVGCLMLAGGQATRLKAVEPKGTLPLSPIKGKSLFQLFLEKTLAASNSFGKPLPLAIMTSPLNHSATLTFLEKNRWFGLPSEQCSLFLQGTLPFLDEKGNWVLEAPGVLAEGPDGNGGVLTHFLDSGLWAKWKERGIDFVNVILIDNPLADPFDVELIGSHAQTLSEVTLKTVFRKDENEKVGLLGTSEGKVRVVEYSELTEKEKNAKNPDGSLRWKIANISLFCFSMDFIQKVVRGPNFYLPWHVAKKNAQIFKDRQKEDACIWKCETFIFDLLNFVQKVNVLVYPREEVFSPWKNSAGESSLATVQESMLARDRKIYEQITGLPPPERKFELAQSFYYPTAQLLGRWRGKALPDKNYIEAED